MKKRILLQRLCLLFVSLSLGISWSTAQTGYREKENIEYLSKEEIHETLQRLRTLRTTLPERVDHSQSKYMSSLVNQGAMGSCGSASRICYMFGYEINNYRDLDGKKQANMYPSHFTWLLTGQNSDKENMAIFNGIPTVPVYGGRQYSSVYGGNVYWPDRYKEYGWMNGYEKWRSAMDNRLEKAVNVKINSDEALEYLKRWIYDHHGDNSFNEGGVVGGGAASSGWVTKNIPSGKYKGGELIVTAYGSAIDHGIVFSGYDDNIEYDLNGNGEIEDDERGALILLNSWGDWGNKGCVYVPYKIVKSYGGGLGAEFYYIRKDYKPLDVFRIKMEYNQRSNLKISIGVSSDPTAKEPEKTIEAEHFKYAGFEPIPLLGKYNGVINTDPMEFGLDLTDLITIGIDTRQSYRYFLVIETKTTTGTGVIHDLEVIRHKYVDESNPVTEIVGKIDSEISIGKTKRIVIPIDVPGTDIIEPTHLYIPQKRLSVKSVSTEEKSGEGANNGQAIHAIDGNESTYWHSAWASGTPAYPHHITFEIDSTYTLNGFEYLPRQNHANGRIGDYELYVLNSPDEEGTLVASGTFENSASLKRAFFEPISGKFVRLVNLRAADGDGNTCVAEFDLFYSAKKGVPNSIESIEQETLTIQQQGSIIQISGANGESLFALYNIQGQKIMEKKIDATHDGITELNLSHLTGIYILQVVAPNQTKSLKILLH